MVTVTEQDKCRACLTNGCDERGDDQGDNDALEHVKEQVADEAHIELRLALGPWLLAAAP